MKNIFKHMGAALWVAATLGLAVMPAKADSFNITNTIRSLDVLASWPTNSAGTNGLNVLTGGAIGLANNSQAGFYASGYNVSNIASTLTFKLVRSAATAPPVYNATNVTWETGTPAISIDVAIPATAGPFYYYTNLGEGFLYGANWIGCTLITNAGAGVVSTNLDAGISKKILPIRFP